MVKRFIIFSFLLMGGLSLSAQELKLFSSEAHDAADYPYQVVMDFMERYFSKDLPSLRHTTIENKMADDKVFFRKGSRKDLSQVTGSTPFSITLNDKYYEVKWLRNEEPFISVVFPAQYDLLFGMQKDEALNTLKQAILTAPKRSFPVRNPMVSRIKDEDIWKSESNCFELESLNDATYYKKENDSIIPYYDNEHIDYSAANLFHGLISDVNYRMYVEQSVYGMKTISYTITLQQWLNYCSQLGLKVYFAIEEQRKDGLLAMVIANSRELGFNHLMSVVIPDNFVTNRQATLKVRLSPYIPVHNVKNLYKKEVVNNKKKRWQ